MANTTTTSTTARKATMAGAGKSPDAIAMLKADHAKVKGMFEEYDSLGDRAQVSKRKLATQICTELIKHTAAEEEVFYPALREASKEMEDLLDEAAVEHASAKELIAQILTMQPDEELYDAKVKVLSEQIDHHVEEEEKEMFPKAAKLKLDFDAMAASMQEVKDGVEVPTNSTGH
jgi:hemerythrin superfamily protein